MQGADYSPDLDYDGDPFAHTSPSTATSDLSPEERWQPEGGEELEAGPAAYDMGPVWHAMKGRWDNEDKVRLLDELQEEPPV